MATNNPFLPGLAFGGADAKKPWAVRSLSEFMTYLEATECDNSRDAAAFNSMDGVDLRGPPTDDINATWKKVCVHTALRPYHLS